MIIETLKVNKVNVYLRDGTEILGKDIPLRPSSDNDRIISYFDEDKSFHIIPLDLVRHIVFYWEDKKGN